MTMPTPGLPQRWASPTKGGLNAVTGTLAIEYEGRGIRSNAMALGVIGTPMHDPTTDADLAEPHPLGRCGVTG